jgi:hypothetical protein
MTVDITIGIADHGRQLTLSVEQDQESIEKQVTEALAGSMLSLADDKGRKVIVPTAKIAFVEIGPADSRRVGFVSGS